jgi:hypothetical protein
MLLTAGAKLNYKWIECLNEKFKMLNISIHNTGVYPHELGLWENFL